jgi:excisionase family DNA binding protein
VIGDRSRSSASEVVATVMQMFAPDYMKQFVKEAEPYLRELVNEILVHKDDSSEVISVDYKEAGRRIGTTYEGIRKMVRKGELKAFKRGRRRGILVSELKSYAKTNSK